MTKLEINPREILHELQRLQLMVDGASQFTSCVACMIGTTREEAIKVGEAFPNVKTFLNDEMVRAFIDDKPKYKKAMLAFYLAIAAHGAKLLTEELARVEKPI